MITALTKTRAGRIALIPVVILCGAYSWFSYVDGTKNVQDQGRLKKWWGWLDPRLDSEWALFLTEDDSRYHLLKNMGSEWARLDAQRAYKAMSFMMVTAFLLALALVAITIVLV